MNLFVVRGEEIAFIHQQPIVKRVFNIANREKCLHILDSVSAPMEAQLRNNVPKVEKSADGKEHLSFFVPVVYHQVTCYPSPFWLSGTRPQKRKRSGIRRERPIYLLYIVYPQQNT